MSDLTAQQIDIPDQIILDNFEKWQPAEGNQGCLWPGTFSSPSGNSEMWNKDQAVGTFSIDARLDCCFTSIGFLKRIGVNFDPDETRAQPRKLDDDEAFLSVGTVKLRLKMAGSEVTWTVSMRVMPYRRLCRYDDDNPDESKMSWFDVGLGYEFLKQFREEERNYKGATVAEMRNERVWEVKLPKVPEKMFEPADNPLDEKLAC